jgi:hypothetical protein
VFRPTRLDARNSSSVRQLNQPGWVYTWTSMVFSGARRDARRLRAAHRHLRLGALKVALEEGRFDLECLRAVVGVLPRVGV